MAKEFNGNGNLTFLRVNRDGLLYRGVNDQEKSLTPEQLKEKGFNPVKLKDDRIVYHKTFSGTEDGFLNFITIKEKQFKDGTVKQVELIIQGDEGSDMITFPLFKTNGTLNDYVKNLATLLPNLDFSKKINIVPSRKKNDRGYVQQNVFINYPDDEGDSNFVSFAHKYGKDGDIPPAEKVEGIDGEKYDFTKQDTYLYKILTAQIDRFKEFKGTTSTPDTNSGSDSAPEQNGADSALGNEEEHDDLPF